MECSGIVLQIKDNKAYLMTESCEVVCIKKQPGMYEGMEIIFEPSEKINNTNTVVKYSAVIASVAAVFIAVMLFAGLINSNKIYAYIDVDINTSWQLMVNKDNKVIDVEIKDSNSKFLIEDLNYKSKPLESVVVDMVEKLNQNGLIDLNSENKVLITTCLKDEDEKQNNKYVLKNLESSFSIIKNELLSRNIEPYFLEAKSEDRKLAADNNISMGRYSIYKISKEKGIDIDLEKLKQNKINEILEKVNIDNSFNKDKSDSDKVNQSFMPNENVRDSAKNNNTDKRENESYTGNEPYNGQEIDLSVSGINDLDVIKSIEAANIETQKVIQEIQRQVNNDIAFETDKANKEISKIKMDSSMSSDQKNKKIKQIESELINKINEIKKAGNERAQTELDKLEKKVKDLLPKIN